MKKLLISLALLFAAICPAQEDYVRDGSPQPDITWALGNRPILSILSGTNGVDQLDPNLTINGTTVTPMFRYKGGDADGTDWDEWDYGATLGLNATPVPTYNQGSPLLGPNDDSVLPNTGGYYQDSGTTLGNIGTDDLWIEGIFKSPDSGNTESVLSKTGTTEIKIQWKDTGEIRLIISDGVDVLEVKSGVLTSDTWHYVAWALNRDENSLNGAAQYVNAVFVDDGNPSLVGALNPTTGLALLAQNAGTNPSSSNLAYLAAWKYADWMQAGAAGPTEWAAIAKERFLKLTGFYSPKGTVTYTRPTEAVLSKYEGSATKLYTVGDGWPRMVYHVDSASDEIKGYLAETEDENEILYSEEFDDATWSKTRTTVDSDALLAPNKELTADGLVGHLLNNTHYIEQALASSAAEHIFAVYAKAGDQDWLYIAIPTVANANAYYDLSTCSTGTVGAGAVAYVKDLGDGWCRPIIVYTGGAPSHAHRIYSAEADTDHTFTGDGTTVNTWLWGATHSDEGLGYVTSYIKTEASLVTRVKDNLNITGLGSMLSIAKTTKYNILLQDKPPNATNNYLTAYSNAGSTNDALASYVHVTADLLALFINKGGITKAHLFTGGSDLTDGVIHDIGLKHRDDYQSRIVDGVTISPTDNDSDIMTTRNQLDIGQTWSQGSQLNGVIGQIKIYKK